MSEAAAVDVAPPACPRHGAVATFSCARCAGFGCPQCTVLTPWGPICPACRTLLAGAPATPGVFTWEEPGGRTRSSLWRSSYSLSVRPGTTWPLVPEDGPLAPAIWFALWNNWDPLESTCRHASLSIL